MRASITCGVVGAFLAISHYKVGQAAAPVNDACGPGNGSGVYINANGDRIMIEGGQVSMAGATLFVDFFTTPSSSNDWNDVDGDGFAGFDPFTFPFVDQLATQYVPGSDLATWWAFQYRSVGSVNGFNEFVDNQTCGVMPTSVPSEKGIFNGVQYADNGAITLAGSSDDSTGTPLTPCEIEGAFLDVPSAFAVQIPGEPRWDRTPGSPGYGLNPIPSSDGSVNNLQSLSRTCGTCSGSNDACISDGQCAPGGCNGSGVDCRIDEDCPEFTGGEICVGAEACVFSGEPVALNANHENPDENTLFDIVAAWVPVTLIANRGTGVENIKFSEAQYLFVTGRMPNGENLVGATRDVGSGTRNATMSSLGIDTSWGRGDNLGSKTDDTSTDNLGDNHQPTNKGGSSRMEGAVQNNRLAIGYTGLAGGSRSAVDAQGGKYEILNTCKDVSATGQPACDCEVSGFVRPGVDTVLDNCDPCSSYQIAGSGSFSVRGNPNANRDLIDPEWEDSQPLDNQAVADYLNNIADSIDAFAGDPFADECNGSRACSTSGTACTDAAIDCPAAETCDVIQCSNDGDCPGTFCSISGIPCLDNGDCAVDETCEADFCKSKLNMPGELLATQFFLPAALDCIHDLSEPLRFHPTSTNQVLQDFIRADSVIFVPAYGSVNPAGQVPKRNSLFVRSSFYSDGSSTGSYTYWDGSWKSINSGLRLSRRNRVQADFDGDGVRTADDAAEFVNAYLAPRSWQQSLVATGSATGSALGDMDADDAIPEVIGDLNGDGNLTKEDLRYFADGLALVAGVLDRKAGAVAIDNAIVASGFPYPWADSRAQLLIPPALTEDPSFETPADIAAFLATGATYEPGDFRGDVAGASPVAGGPPTGWDGRIDDKDIDYVCRHIGAWDQLDQAVFVDLSCDMNGDLTVSTDDLAELVEGILKTQVGDVNLSGTVDAADQAIVQASIDDPNPCNADASCGWADGDTNCDGVVDGTDSAVFEACSLANVIDVFPPSCAIDAREPHDLNDANIKFGWDEIVMTMSCSPAASAVDAADFEVSTVPADNPPAITNVAIDTLANTVTLQFDQPIPPGAWTCVSHTPTGGQWCWGYLPADAGQDGLSSANDINALINSINNVPGAVLPPYATDMNRSGLTSAQDILRLIDLLNGASSFDPWIAQSLPPCPVQ